MSTAPNFPILTFFYRERWAFEALEQRIIPTYGSDPIFIASVGCSEGKELYTILLQNWNQRGRLALRGYDPNPEMLEIANSGIFEIERGEYEDDWICSLPIQKGEAYREEDLWRYDIHLKRIIMSPEARRHVWFQSADILASPLPDHNDIVLAMNLLYHFSDKERAAALQNISLGMRVDDYLVCEPNPGARNDLGRYEIFMRDLSSFGLERQKISMGPYHSQIYRRISS
jgi:chemotaxis methyl-accepting protein methylase